MELTVHARVDYIPFKGGYIRASGGYEENITTRQARENARLLLGTYGHDSVSVEVNGVIVATVSR